MKENRFFTDLENEKKALSQMNFREKADHLWTYYKGALGILVAAVMLISVICTGFINRNKNILSSGTTVNATLSQEAIDYLSALCYERNPEQKNGEFNLHSVILEDFEDTTDYEFNYNVLVQIITMCSEQDLDYIIMDEVAMKLLLVQECFMDLSEILTQDELTALGDKVISARAEDQTETRPYAINIADLPFIKDNTDAKGPVYFAFVNNTPRREVCRQIWEDILAWPQK